MATKCLDVPASSLQFLIELYPALLIVIIAFFPFYKVASRWTPAVWYQAMEKALDEVVEFDAEGVKEGLLEGGLSEFIRNELFTRHAMLTARFLAASNYKWFQKTLFLEVIAGLSFQLYQMEKEFKDVHELLALDAKGRY